MTRLMTEKELEAFEATRDIEAEILLGIDDMLAKSWKHNSRRQHQYYKEHEQH
jgi:hypothetical protein